MEGDLVMANLKDYYWTVAYIAKSLKGEKADKEEINTEANNIRKYFKVIITEKLELEEDVLTWFRESDSPSGELIFGNIEIKEIPNAMNDMIKLFQKKLISVEEQENIEMYFKKLLPLFRDKNFIENGSNENILDWQDEYDEHMYIIRNAIERYFERKMLENFKKKLFVEVDGNKITSRTVRMKIYNLQLELISEWAIKWYFTMQYIEAVRIAERFEKGYATCMKYNIPKKERELFFETGKIENEKIDEFCKETEWITKEDLCKSVLNIYMKEREETEDALKEQKKILGLDNIKERKKEIRNRELYFTECVGLVTKILNNNLKKVAKEDYSFLLSKALKELETISSTVKGAIRENFEEKYQSELCDNGKRSMKDLEKLHSVKTELECMKNRRKTAAEIMGYV